MASINSPLFSAVSPAARDLTLLLRCIAFASKTQVRLSPEGLRFSAQETSVMEGKCFLTILLSNYSDCNQLSYFSQRPSSQLGATKIPKPLRTTQQKMLLHFLPSKSLFLHCSRHYKYSLLVTVMRSDSNRIHTIRSLLSDKIVTQITLSQPRLWDHLVSAASRTKTVAVLCQSSCPNQTSRRIVT